MDQNGGQRPRSPQEDDTISKADVATLVQPWLRLSEQLMPLIGESGFCALFGRALRLSTPRFERLSSCDSARPVADLLTSLTRTLNEIGPGQAGAANDALLGTFTQRLVVIGLLFLPSPAWRGCPMGGRGAPANAIAQPQASFPPSAACKAACAASSTSS